MLQNVLIFNTEYFLSIYLLLKEVMAVCHWISIIIFYSALYHTKKLLSLYNIEMNSLYFTKTYPLSFS